MPGRPFQLSTYSRLASLNVGVSLAVASLGAELCCQAAIFVKKYTIEARAEVLEIRYQVIQPKVN